MPVILPRGGRPGQPLRSGAHARLLRALLDDLALREGLGAGLGARLLGARAVRGRDAELLLVLRKDLAELARDVERAVLLAVGDPALRELLLAHLVALGALAARRALAVLDGLADCRTLRVPELGDLGPHRADRVLRARHDARAAEGLPARGDLLLGRALLVRARVPEAPAVELLGLPVLRDVAGHGAVPAARVDRHVTPVEVLDATLLLARALALRRGARQAEPARAVLVLAPHLRGVTDDLLDAPAGRVDEVPAREALHRRGVRTARLGGGVGPLERALLGPGLAPGLLERAGHEEGALLGRLRDRATHEALDAVVPLRVARLVPPLDADGRVDVARREPRLLDRTAHRVAGRAEPVGEATPEVAVAVRGAAVPRAVHVVERGLVGHVRGVDVEAAGGLVLDVHRGRAAPAAAVRVVGQLVLAERAPRVGVRGGVAVERVGGGVDLLEEAGLLRVARCRVRARETGRPLVLVPRRCGRGHERLLLLQQHEQHLGRDAARLRDLRDDLRGPLVLRARVLLAVGVLRAG